MTTLQLQELFDEVLARRNELDPLDDEIREVLRHLESAFLELRPGVMVETYCHPADDSEAFYLIFGKLKSKQWRMQWAQTDDDEPVALLDTPRETRASVFNASVHGGSHIERFLRDISAAMAHDIEERKPALARAQLLSTTLDSLGYTKPPQGGS